MSKFVAFAFTAAATVAFSTVPAFAAPAESESSTFTRGGTTYVFTETDMGSYKLLSGHDDSGRTFALRVAGSRVTGVYNNDHVEFSAPPRSSEIAAR